MDDEKMDHFNNLFKEVTRKGEICYDVATTDRMQYLHAIGCDLQFADNAKPLARTNLIKCGGMEMPVIVAGLLKNSILRTLLPRLQYRTVSNILPTTMLHVTVSMTLKKPTMLR